MKKKVYKRQINDQEVSFKKWPSDVTLPSSGLTSSGKNNNFSDFQKLLLF